MKVYELAAPEELRVRAHPWTQTDANPEHRYVDFRAHPELIRPSLEDLLPWTTYPATESFYKLVEWVNGPDSPFESNDLAFEGVSQNQGPHSTLNMQAGGRLMILFRDLEANTSPQRVGALAQDVAMALSHIDTGSQHGIVGISIVEIELLELDLRGRQLLLSFFAWGDDTASTMANFDQLLQAVHGALRTV